ncbi:MAG: hypothetical protein ACM3PT_07030 [Deltaproteobacteria bacterium]
MKKYLLWIVAILLMFAAVFYQRMTGPTNPFRGKLYFDIQEYKYSLLRSQETTSAASIELPVPNIPKFDATLHYKRLGTKDSITSVPFKLQSGRYYAYLPVQPAAGKMTYYVTINANDKSFRIPERVDEEIILRYKDPVPLWVLIPHILFMFLAVLFGIRAGLSALFEIPKMRLYSLISLILMTVGGMVLGPIVQKYAFGAYWTGWPFGQDYTDNKMLVMWLVWVLVFILAKWKLPEREKMNRWLVGVATVVMLLMYLIPHSMGGSTLDYDKVDKGIHPKEAIKTGG